MYFSIYLSIIKDENGKYERFSFWRKDGSWFVFIADYYPYYLLIFYFY